MGILRINKKENFAQISNELLRDKSISYGARGLLAMLLSFPNNWTVYTKDLTNRSDTDTEGKVQKYINELKNAGYMKRTRYSEGYGKISWLTEVNEFPIYLEENNENYRSPEIQPSNSTNLKNTSLEKVGHKKNTDLNEYIEEKENTTLPIHHTVPFSTSTKQSVNGDGEQEDMANNDLMTDETRWQAMEKMTNGDMANFGLLRMNDYINLIARCIHETELISQWSKKKTYLSRLSEVLFKSRSIDMAKLNHVYGDILRCGLFNKAECDFLTDNMIPDRLQLPKDNGAFTVTYTQGINNLPPAQDIANETLASFERGWNQAQNGQTHSVDTLWQGVELDNAANDDLENEQALQELQDKVAKLKALVDSKKIQESPTSPIDKTKWTNDELNAMLKPLVADTMQNGRYYDDLYGKPVVVDTQDHLVNTNKMIANHLPDTGNMVFETNANHIGNVNKMVSNGDKMTPTENSQATTCKTSPLPLGFATPLTNTQTMATNAPNQQKRSVGQNNGNSGDSGKTVKQLHREAMDLLHQGDFQEDSTLAKKLFADAMALEESAARLVPATEKAEPTRSILFRSAASMAYRAGLYEKAETLISGGLKGCQSQKVKSELLALRKDVQKAVKPVLEKQPDLAQQFLKRWCEEVLCYGKRDEVTGEYDRATYDISWAREKRTVKSLLTKGIDIETKFNDLAGSYRYMKQKPYCADRHVFIQEVASNLPAWIQAGRPSSQPVAKPQWQVAKEENTELLNLLLLVTKKYGRNAGVAAKEELSKTDNGKKLLKIITAITGGMYSPLVEMSEEKMISAFWGAVKKLGNDK